MFRGMFNRFISHMMIINLFVGLSAYLLRLVNGRYTWVFAISVVVMFWLGIVKFFAVLDSRSNRFDS